MSGLSSIHRVPMTFHLPAMGGWQDLCEGWGNALLGRKEIRVDQAIGGTATPHALLALQQNVTGLLAQEVVMVKHRARQVLAAMRTLDDRLQLVSWRVNADGSLLHTGSSSAQAAAIQQVRLVRARNYVVACRTQKGELQLSRWDVSNTGAIYLAGESTPAAQQVRWLEMAALDLDHIVTFALTEAGVWQLALWQLQDEDAFLLLQTHKIPAFPVSDGGLRLCLQPDGTLHLFTLCSATPATFLLHIWHYQPGETLRLVASHRLYSPEAVKIIVTDGSGDQLITVVQTLTGQLRLVTWQLLADGQPRCTAERLLYAPIDNCACQKHRDGFSLFYRTLMGDLQLEVWQQQPDGTVVLLATGQTPTAMGKVSCCDDRLDGNAPFLTAMIDIKGALILTTWQ